MIRCIVIDDEQLIRELIVDYIEKIHFLELKGHFKNPLEAMELINSGEVDLIFIDIQMPGIKGNQFISTLKNPPLVIFITAYQEYALEGYTLDIVDYLLKPIVFDRFLKACNKANELKALQDLKRETAPAKPGYMFVYVEYKQVKVDFSSILYIEGMKDYSKIFTTNSDRPIITRMTLQAITALLPETDFIRVHKSYIVQVNKIESVKRDLIRIRNTELPIGRSYFKEVQEKLGL